MLKFEIIFLQLKMIFLDLTINLKVGTKKEYIYYKLNFKIQIKTI